MRAALPFLVVVGLATGCSTWRAQGLTPGAVIRREHPERMRVETLDGAHVDLTWPRVVGDSLVGIAEDGPRAIALADVDHVAVRRENETRSRIAVPVVAGLVLAMIILVDELSAMPGPLW